MAEITYDEVSEWWDNSEWYMSTYPPSVWFEYCEREGIDIDELRKNAEKLEELVGEAYEKDDGRTCECEWAEHESNCDQGKG